MTKVKGALTRKYGPLPAWAWLTVLGLGIWYYRNHYGTSATTSASTTAATDTATTPQDIVPLQPGESAYDPNSGALVTAPGGGGSGNGDTSGVGGGTGLPPISLGPINITPPSKAGSKTGGKPVKAKTPTKSTKRSSTTVKKQGRTISLKQRIARGTAFGPTGKKRVAKPAASVGHVARQRPLTPALRPAMVQRPIASATPRNRPSLVANPPRPSAPETRKANRTVATKKVKPATKKRTK